MSQRVKSRPETVPAGTNFIRVALTDDHYSRLRAVCGKIGVSMAVFARTAIVDAVRAIEKGETSGGA